METNPNTQNDQKDGQGNQFSQNLEKALVLHLNIIGLQKKARATGNIKNLPPGEDIASINRTLLLQEVELDAIMTEAGEAFKQLFARKALHTEIKKRTISLQGAVKKALQLGVVRYANNTENEAISRRIFVGSFVKYYDLNTRKSVHVLPNDSAKKGERFTMGIFFGLMKYAVELRENYRNELKQFEDTKLKDVIFSGSARKLSLKTSFYFDNKEQEVSLGLSIVPIRGGGFEVTAERVFNCPFKLQFLKGQKITIRKDSCGLTAFGHPAILRNAIQNEVN